MATKTFKIGECCKGGIITAIAMDEKITIIGKDWDFSAGSSRGSNQSNAKEWCREEFTLSEFYSNTYNDLYEFLSYLTTHYYAEEVIKWIKTKVKFPVSLW
jgi:hypothetical protein